MLKKHPSTSALPGGVSAAPLLLAAENDGGTEVGATVADVVVVASAAADTHGASGTLGLGGAQVRRMRRE